MARTRRAHGALRLTPAQRARTTASTTLRPRASCGTSIERADDGEHGGDNAPPTRRPHSSHAARTAATSPAQQPHRPHRRARTALNSIFSNCRFFFPFAAIFVRGPKTRFGGAVAVSLVGKVRFLRVRLRVCVRAARKARCVGGKRVARSFERAVASPDRAPANVPSTEALVTRTLSLLSERALKRALNRDLGPLSAL